MRFVLTLELETSTKTNMIQFRLAAPAKSLKALGKTTRELFSFKMTEIYSELTTESVAKGKCSTKTLTTSNRIIVTKN